MSQAVCKDEKCSNPAAFDGYCGAHIPIKATGFDQFAADPFAIKTDVAPTEQQEAAARNLRGYYLALLKSGFSEDTAQALCATVLATAITAGMAEAAKRKE